MALPLDVRDLTKSTQRLLEERERAVRIAVLVEADAPDDLIDAVREALRPRTARATLEIEVAETGTGSTFGSGADAVIALAGSGRLPLAQGLTGPRRAQIPTAVVTVGTAQDERRLAEALVQPTGDVIVREAAAPAADAVGAWLADNLASKRLSLAHNFVFMRRYIADEAVKTTAWQNALIGSVSLIPGADMPLMTANQAKMLLQVAAAYGQPLGVERIKELAAIVGGGLLFRALARQALIAVPVLGWAVKGGIAYSGTLAMGKAAIAYFEEGADLSQVTERFREIRDKAAHRLPRKARTPQAVTPQDAPPRLSLPAHEDG